ncbi:3-hydroxy-9,10-secoandrosta-1,3,5(10)-triene-9,17-dione monooxygenase oxygenase subunit [Actinomadura sp. DC4]|uniref:3-hydroxy-9,10-secoandrosta-1,3,5(10)-triene-9, 17-dione monooxygenase oxygenase subunit n=1 Tax=Actinomadura sp. DC4 TaxID=3055069 RepID=UPI0025B2080F|nr:3-hydroxy-9,10-secoandrosta-1,3,5(10)-triene-9,17-dione monooxygenase oxygenase subunit [Actinomadura sp. DC4]MDN3359042.1 acyl-CoA dehydrogenase family protein [Actinomadura sp. DC4]
MASDVLESVRELLPAIRERASRTESERRVPEETVSALVDAGFFAMLRPARYGGGESDPVDYFTAVRLLASACPSTGWVASLLGITPWHVALLEPRMCADVWGEDQRALVSSSYAPTGRLVPADGGYRLTGAWRSAPGAEHCDWILLGTLMIGSTGDPVDYTAAVVPRSDYTLKDGWNVVGLRGAGGMDVQVDDVFVPPHRIFGAAGRRRIAKVQRGPDAPALYRVPFAAIHGTALVAPLLGAAEGAYQYHLARMRRRSELSHGGRKPSGDEFAPVAVARGSGEIDASVLQLERDLREFMDHALRNERTPIELRLRARRDQVRSAERAAEAVDLLLKAAGGHGVQAGNPIQRAWRDVHTGAAHVVNDVDQGLSLYGRWAYGLGVDDSLILV